MKGDKLKYGNIKTTWEWRCGCGPVHLDTGSSHTGTESHTQTDRGDSHTSTPSPHCPQQQHLGGAPTTLRLQGCSFQTQQTPHTPPVAIQHFFFDTKTIWCFSWSYPALQKLSKNRHTTTTKKNPPDFLSHPHLLQFLTQPYSLSSYSTFLQI